MLEILFSNGTSMHRIAPHDKHLPRATRDDVDVGAESLPRGANACPWREGGRARSTSLCSGVVLPRVRALNARSSLGSVALASIARTQTHTYTCAHRSAEKGVTTFTSYKILIPAKNSRISNRTSQPKHSTQRRVSSLSVSECVSSFGVQFCFRHAQL